MITIDVTTRAPPRLEPRLFWPGHPEDHTVFPERHVLEARYRATDSSRAPLGAFVEALFTATERVLILDYFFGDGDLPDDLLLALEMTLAVDIRVCAKVDDGVIAARLRASRIERFANPPHGVRWLGGMDRKTFPFAHDRFAVVDDELWHFGGTVGGGQPGLTAVSRGWSAAETGAECFFGSVWKHLERR